MTIGGIISVVLGVIALISGMAIEVYGNDARIGIGFIFTGIVFVAVFIVGPIIYMNTEGRNEGKTKWK